MSDDRLARVFEIFEGAADRADAERAVFLAGACGGDAGLQRDVEALLAWDGTPSSFMDAPAVPAPCAPEELPLPSYIGRRLGAYRIRRELGEGGMGEVYLAERADDQFRKQVAIKLIRRGIANPELLRRFRHERQMLARLDHPHIARLIDGGLTDEHIPYLVMEYVDGERILDYCDRRALSISDRVILFRQVCAAVQAAHENLIVHRDLKPANILVTAAGVPKLLDFGVAKFLAPDPADDLPDHTRTAFRLLTPEYASPEQVRGEPTTVASDVYALGVILYELLTGHRPYRLAKQQPHVLAQAICEQEPERPSTVVMKTASAPACPGQQPILITPQMVSRPREGRPDRLRRRLSGDLDTIVLKALRKDPRRRYGSVQKLSDDLQRHLERRPVRAQPDTLTYRVRKYVARNAKGVAAGLVALVAIAAGALAAVWQARVAQVERDRAEARFADVRQLATAFMFEFHDAIKDLDGSIRARQLLIGKATEHLDRLAAEAGRDSRLQRELAMAYQQLGEIQGGAIAQPHLGDSTSALASQRKALGLREALAAGHPADRQLLAELAASYARVGELLLNTGDVAGAVANQRKAVAIQRALVAALPDRVENRFALALGLRNLFIFLATHGDYRAADESLLETVRICEELFALNPADAEVRRELASSHRYLGDEMWLQGQPAQAWESFRRALALAEEWMRSDPASREARRGVYLAHFYIGNMWMEYGNPGGAIEHFRHALALIEGSLQREPVNARARHDLGLAFLYIGEAHAAAGEPARALEAYRRQIQIKEALVRTEPQSTLHRREIAAAYMRVAEALRQLRSPAALGYARRSQHVFEELLKEDPDHVEIRRRAAQAMALLARLLTEAGQPVEARRHMLSALAIQKVEATKSGALGNRIAEYAWSLLTATPQELRDPAAALVHARRAADLTHWQHPGSLNTLALAHRLTGDSAAAAAAAEKGLALLPEPPTGNTTSKLHQELSAHLIAKGRGRHR